MSNPRMLHETFLESDILRECWESLRIGYTHVMLNHPKGAKPPRGFPRGEVMCISSIDESISKEYPLDKVIAFIFREDKRLKEEEKNAVTK